MNVVESPTLAKVGGVAHGFFGRRGGVSQGLFASLNCGYGSSDVRVFAGLMFTPSCQQESDRDHPAVLHLAGGVGAIGNGRIAAESCNRHAGAGNAFFK